MNRITLLLLLIPPAFAQYDPRHYGAAANGTTLDTAAIQKAIDAKASKAEIKAALEKYVASRKAKQADLEKAQDNLRKVLTSRQEAIATVNGLL